MSVERCYECDEETGNAGVGEDSLAFEDEVYCYDCYVGIIIEVATDRKSEIERLNARLKVNAAWEKEELLHNLAHCNYEIEQLKALLNEYGCPEVIK